MQWFVKKQVEKETLAMSLPDKIRMAGGEQMSSDALYIFDRDFEMLLDEAKFAKDVSTMNP